MKKFLFVVVPIFLIILLFIVLSLFKINHKTSMGIVTIILPIVTLLSYFIFLEKHDVKLGLSGFLLSTSLVTASLFIIYYIRGGEIFTAELSLHNLCAIAALALSVAVFEELVFRGLILGLLLKHPRFPIVLALFFQAAAFAASHLHKEPLFYVQTLAGGLFLGWTVIKTRSLWFSIGFHFGWDLIVVLSTGYHSMNFGHLKGLIIFDPNYSYMPDLLFIAASGIAAYVFVAYPGLLRLPRAGRAVPA